MTGQCETFEGIQCGWDGLVHVAICPIIKNKHHNDCFAFSIIYMLCRAGPSLSANVHEHLLAVPFLAQFLWSKLIRYFRFTAPTVP